MRGRTTDTRGRTVLQRAFFLSIFIVVTWGTSTWASTRVGNMELQMWYRMRHAFHTDGGDHFDWVQWRNEVFAWLIYEDLIKNGKLLDKVEIPWVQSAALNARYRFRADPVYVIRDHYKNVFDGDERGSFIIPENGFRDLFLDMNFGEVGPGSLSMRVGNQQIVWGESDLFRSLDIINPLRLDQNTVAGEKFDEFRTPIFALKFLYSIGNVGQYLSEVAIEPWYSPRYRTITSDLIVDGVLRLPSHLKGCLDENGKLIPFDLTRCGQARSVSGQRIFVPYRPPWLNSRRTQNPWSLFGFTANNRHTPDNVTCLNRFCSPDVIGQRASLWPIGRDKRDEQYLKGWGGKAQGGGLRILGKTWFGLDFTLNYMFLPTGPTGVFDLNRFLVDPRVSPGPPQFKPELFYGDPAVAQALGFPPELVAGHSFADGLRRCVSNGGKSSGFESKDRGYRAPTVLIGADLWGFNNPARFGPNGALQPDGTPKPGRHHSVRPPLTFCLPFTQDYLWKHVMGFTGTYNDFDYTGAVFRLEQSWSSKEVIRQLPGGFGARFGQPISYRSVRESMHRFTPVWRSMVGFDLVRSLAFFQYIPGIHRSFYQQQWFVSGQWLMENNWSNIANNICQDNDSIGPGVTEEEAAAFRAEHPGQRVYPGRHCRRYRWNHLLTLVAANQGLFSSRLETRNAIAFEPRGKQYLLYSQWWWRNVLGYSNVELSAGVAWFPGSYMNDSWTSLNYYAPRDQLWFEFTYYLL